MIADTSGLLALFNRTEPEHEPVRRLVAGIEDPLVVSPHVVAELDYLVATRVGVMPNWRYSRSSRVAPTTLLIWRRPISPALRL